MYFQKNTSTGKSRLISHLLHTIFFLTTLSFPVLAQDYIDYQVQKGDCLWTIAKQFQLSIQDITQTNNLSTKETLQPGILLKIPQNGAQSPILEGTEDTVVHTVKKGENLWNIAQQYRLSLEDLSRVNTLRRPDALYVGQEIKIPLNGNNKTEEEPCTGNSGSQSVLSFQEEKENLKDISSSLNQEFRETVDEITYVVKPGESLWTIAQNYQVSLNEISQANSLDSKERLSIGQIIKIPLRNKDSNTSVEIANRPEKLPEPSVIEHIVAYGENISMIARKYHLPVETICQLNHISQKDYIFPGQRLKIKVDEQVLSEIALQGDTAAKQQNVAEVDSKKIEPETVYYTVKPGDTLWNIAQKYCVSMEGIIAVNHLNNKNKLSVGQVLQIPAIGGKDTTKQTIEYIVTKGDSLWNIAQKFDVKMHEIISLNELKNITHLSIGQKLKIPASSAAIAQQGTITSSTAVQKSEVKDIVHYVQKGETLWQISRRYGVSLQSITKANGISENSRILVGQKLIIPNARTAPGTGSSPSFIWPLNGLITSHFGNRTLGGRQVYHTGIDISSRTGSSIRAAESGKVSFVGYLSGYGNTVIIDHAGGYSTVYSHNSVNSVQKGQTVSKGDIIGQVGATGNATGPHLHFEVRVSGKPNNPLNYLP